MTETFLNWVTDRVDVVKLSKQGCKTSKKTKMETENKLNRRELMGEEKVDLSEYNFTVLAFSVLHVFDDL